MKKRSKQILTLFILGLVLILLAPYVPDSASAYFWPQKRSCLITGIGTFGSSKSFRLCVWEALFSLRGVWPCY